MEKKRRERPCHFSDIITRLAIPSHSGERALNNERALGTRRSKLRLWPASDRQTDRQEEATGRTDKPSCPHSSPEPLLPDTFYTYLLPNLLI